MKKKLHKTLLALLLVLIPPYFLVFTEEGNRVSDNAILWLFGQQGLALNLAEADSSFSESDIREVFPDLDWQCGKLSSPFGQSACNSVIASFNDLPAHHAVLYFDDNRLSAIRIDYRRRYHRSLWQQLVDTLGQPTESAPGMPYPENPDQVLQWDTGKGLVVLKKTIGESDQPALMWIGSAP